MKGTLLILLIAMARVAVASDAGGPIFLKLPEGQHVKVHFVSQGCFHHIQHDFDFHRSPALIAEVTTTQDVWDEAKKAPVKQVTKGTVTLTEEEAAGLDRLVEFYRSKRPGGCTTVDDISITHLQGKKEVTESFKDETCDTYEKVELTTFPEVAYRLISKTPIVKHPRPDPKIEAATNLSLCESLAGYPRFQESFKIEEAIKGWVNSMPESLFAQIRHSKPGVLDSARWWNPLKDGKPTLTWDDFLNAYMDAEKALAGYAWLKSWKELPGKRSVELQLLGSKVGKERDGLTTYVLPVWEHAKMKGVPTLVVLARRGYHSYAEIYFSDQDDRALVCSASASDPQPQGDLDRIRVSWHPKGKRGEIYSQYAIIEKDGTCHVETFVASEN